jgi:hypothetical protein
MEAYKGAEQEAARVRTLTAHPIATASSRFDDFTDVAGSTVIGSSVPPLAPSTPSQTAPLLLPQCCSPSIATLSMAQSGRRVPRPERMTLAGWGGEIGQPSDDVVAARTFDIQRRTGSRRAGLAWWRLRRQRHGEGGGW